MIRTFDLVNSKNETYTLSVANKHTGFLYDVGGLGTEHSPEYAKIGNIYESLIDNINQGVISGTMLFFNPYPYQEFLKFSMFCQDTDLKIHYRTPAGEFWRDGAVTRIEKSESSSDTLKVRIDFTASSLWYDNISKTASGTSIEINSESFIDSPCHLTFSPSSSLTSLSWSQTVDGVTVLTGAISDVSIASSQTVHIRTDTNPYELYRDNNFTNYYGKSDFNTKRFVYIQKGVNVITFNNSGTIGIEGKILYETV